jgi:hypothetical protein
MARQKSAVIQVERVESKILYIRRQKVIIDADLARLYGVTTRRLNEQVKRNIDRFPPDFVFQLSSGEKADVVANCDHLEKLKFSPNLPYAFTEHGAVMVASVLNSPKAVEMSVFVVRAFVRLRRMLASRKDLARKLTQLETKLQTHDRQILQLVAAIRQLMETPDTSSKTQIGYLTESKQQKKTSRKKAKAKRK